MRGNGEDIRSARAGLLSTCKNNAVIYYLFFASQQPVAEKIIRNIFSKYQ